MNTDLDEYCEMCDLPKATCPHGNPGTMVASVLLKPVRTGPTIQASHDSRCGFCGEMMEATEPISHTEECGWVHEDCSVPDDPPETPSAMW